ncbi:MAG: calcium/sodium antiporter [Lachnospiraceae bacterium]|nr:calcium/sodium antiporter [Lachnospiraceae bacterium]
MILVNIVILLIGFVALIKGADIFVDGSTGIAKIFHVSGLVIGLTIAAVGTSAPEFAVSTAAAIEGSNEIAISNVIGSNLFNLLMVLGIGACVRTLPVDESAIRRDFPLSIAAATVVFIVTGWATLPFGFMTKAMTEKNGTLVRPAAILLFVGYIIYIITLIIAAKNNPEEQESTEKISVLKCIVMIIVGAVLIVGGGEAVVDSAKYIASAMGLTETLIGLTVVAFGTSLPELVTSLVAAKKGELGLAVGNALGSNIFNMMVILGVSSTISPIAVNTASLWDLLILITTSILTWIFCIFGRSIKRGEGLIMILCYVGTVVFAIMR